MAYQTGTVDPNGVFGGEAGKDFYYDSTADRVWMCVTSGGAADAVWKALSSAKATTYESQTGANALTPWGMITSVAGSFNTTEGGTLENVTDGAGTLDAASVDFSEHSTINNALQYDGATTRRFVVIATGAISPATNAILQASIKIAIGKDGSAVTGATQEQIPVTADATVPYAISTIVELATSSYVAVMAAAVDTNDDIVFEERSILAFPVS